MNRHNALHRERSLANSTKQPLTKLERSLTMKRTLIALALGLGLANAALADGYVFDEPYWKQALDRSATPTVVAASPRTTLSDAAIDTNGNGFIAESEAEKARLERGGFPQYVQ